MRLEKAWLTTDVQLAALTETYQNASLAAKLLGTFDVGKDVTHIQSWLMPWMRIATVFVTEGVLCVSDQEVRFHSEEYRVFGWRVVGQRPLSFELSATNILSVDIADFSSPVLKIFDLPLTRIRTHLSAPLDNLLLCAGGRIAMPRIRARSCELRRKLIAMHAEA